MDLITDEFVFARTGGAVGNKIKEQRQFPTADEVTA